MQLPYDKVYQVCSGKVDPDLDSDFMDLFPNFWVILLKIFFSETGSQNSFKFGMQLPYDKVYQVCSGNVDPDSYFLDLFPDFQVLLLKIFSEAGSQNIFKFGMELPNDKVY